MKLGRELTAWQMAGETWWEALITREFIFVEVSTNSSSAEVKFLYALNFRF